MAYELVMGLEVHVEMATQSKLFCSCSASFGAEPNQNVCPACSGMPGLLPVVNRKAVELGVTAGLVTNCQISRYSTFDKKSYYYPDLSTSYQVTQFYAPVCTDGHVDITTSQGTKQIGIKQIHIEEDAGKLLHDPWNDKTLVDYNRAGIPLIEIVSKPDFRSVEEVLAYLEKLRSILRYAGVSDCKMEEGSMRADVNISIRPKGQSALGVRTEIKNLNSLKAIARAIEYEYKRHVEALTCGTEELAQETRRWDDAKNQSYSMRAKENATDYLYFPNPDLAPLSISDAWVEEIHTGLPEMPDVKKQRYTDQYALPVATAEIITADRALADLFEATLALCPNAKEIANWIVGELLGLQKKSVGAEGQNAEISCEPAKLAALVGMLDRGEINRPNAKKIFAAMCLEDADPEAYCREHNMQNLADDGLLQDTITEVLAANSKTVADYRGGKKKALDFLFGKTMRILKGNGDPAVLRCLLEEALNSQPRL